jgi:uncharacterized protein YdhG (YjbR/CyaY superfamily)
MSETRKSTKRTAPAAKAPERFTAEERAAMRERARELTSTGKRGAADGERDLLAKIAELGEPDRAMAERIHEIVTANAPQLTPRTWYGQPAYARDGKVVCFFQPAAKFKTRYAMLGFSDEAALDDGSMWPVAYALTRLTKAEEAKIAALIKQAAG